MLQSAAWRSLSPVARCVFLELAAIYNGGNNGFIALSTRDAAERTGCSKDTAARAFTELTAKGFIDCCARGHFDRKSPHASEYRLTLYYCDRTGERASKVFMSWREEQSKSVAGPMRGTASPTSGTVQGSTKENYHLRSDERDRAPFIDPSTGPITGTHIIYQMGCGVDVTKDEAEVADGRSPRRLRNAS
jgi:hypothetical protein